jgi:hypothetical protein
LGPKGPEACWYFMGSRITQSTWWQDACHGTCDVHMCCIPCAAAAAQ